MTSIDTSQTPRRRRVAVDAALAAVVLCAAALATTVLAFSTPGGGSGTASAKHRGLQDGAKRSPAALPVAGDDDEPCASESEEGEIEEDEGKVARPAWELQPAVAATFLAQSYPARSTARLVTWRNERNLKVQLFHSGPQPGTPADHATMDGVPVGRSYVIPRALAHRPIAVYVGSWKSGIYFARLEAPDGRIGYAPFIVRPRALGEHRVLVVLPTYTWQAYNHRDDNGDGRGDTWYAGWKQNWAPRTRPFLARGVPPYYNTYDLHFQQWLDRGGRAVDTYSDDDLNRVDSAAALRRAYDVIVFPGHHEYVTTREYDLVERYRDLGGNLMFLSANNFFWKLRLQGPRMIRVAQWRDLGRPEAALVGVQYIGTDGGRSQAPWIVTAAERAPWLFAGMDVANGEAVSHGGIEIDHTAASSPRGIRVVAEIPALFKGQPRFTAQMTYYEARSGARVFAAGAFSLAAGAFQPPVTGLLTNLFARMTPGGSL